jgi:hypothetical protein
VLPRIGDELACHGEVSADEEVVRELQKAADPGV